MYKVLTTLLILLSLCTKISAQQTNTISGVIADAKGETPPAATIFLNGSQKRTYTGVERDSATSFRLNTIPLRNKNSRKLSEQ